MGITFFMSFFSFLISQTLSNSTISYSHLVCCNESPVRPSMIPFSFRFILCEFAWIFFIKLSLASFLPPEWGWNALAKSPQPGQTHSLDFTFLYFCFHIVHIAHSAPRYFFFSNRKHLSPPSPSVEFKAPCKYTSP